MNEITKTSVFVGIAVVLLLFACLVKQRERGVVTDDIIGRQLLEQFTDPSQVSELQIVKYFPTTGLDDFRVADTGGKWCLPSHQNYPADAEGQMGRIASTFLDQKVLDIAYQDTGGSDVREMHATYGVLDPESKNPGTGDGVGVKVKFTDKNQRVLASLIIGKEVKDTDGLQSYVRVPEQNMVYVMAVNQDHLSTSFDDWVEKNLLDINSFDIQSVRMKDYTVDQINTSQSLVVNQMLYSTFKVEYSATELGEKWRLVTLQRTDAKTGQNMDVVIAPEEKLNESKLEEMRLALEDLTFIDVLRKPESIASSQRDGQILVKSTDEIKLLERFGYIVKISERDDGMTDIQTFARQGEAFIDMKQGIVYRLMFGNLTGTTIAENVSAAASDTDGETTAGKGNGAATNVLSANRYLMILAEFDASLIEKPVPIPLMEVSEEGDEQDIARRNQKREEDERYNKMIEEDYVNAIQSGKQRVQELNLRFADWFFIIPDEVFKKLHVTGNDLIIQPGLSRPDPDYESQLDRSILPFQNLNDENTYVPAVQEDVTINETVNDPAVIEPTDETEKAPDSEADIEEPILPQD